MGILSGTRIIDFSQNISGALCTKLLSDLGAEIVKIDAPTCEKQDDFFYKGASIRYLETMRGKKSFVIAFEEEKNKGIINDLIKTSDGIVESFAPGIMKKYGFSYADASVIKNDICFLSVTGFGQYGPYAQRPYTDTVIQALSGLMSITGEPDGSAVQAGTEIAEEFAGLFSAVGMIGMLRHRQLTGEGQYLDLAQMDCMIHPLENALINYLATGIVPDKIGNRHRVDVPFQDFPTRDGDLLITVNRDNTFAALCRVLGCPEFIEDPRYADCESRRTHIEQITGEIAVRTKCWNIHSLSEALTGAGVPNAPINAIDKVVTSKQINAREMIIEAEHPAVGTYKVVNSPLKFSKTPVKSRLHTPAFGEDTNNIKSELGY